MNSNLISIEGCSFNGAGATDKSDVAYGIYCDDTVKLVKISNCAFCHHAIANPTETAITEAKRNFIRITRNHVDNISIHLEHFLNNQRYFMMDLF